jgi:hypothetical protein
VLPRSVVTPNMAWSYRTALPWVLGRIVVSWGLAISSTLTVADVVHPFHTWYFPFISLVNVHSAGAGRVLKSAVHASQANNCHPCGHWRTAAVAGHPPHPRHNIHPIITLSINLRLFMFVSRVIR